MSTSAPYPLQLEFHADAQHHPVAPLRAVAAGHPAPDDRLGAALPAPGPDPDQLLHGAVHRGASRDRSSTPSS